MTKNSQSTFNNDWEQELLGKDKDYPQTIQDETEKELSEMSSSWNERILATSIALEKIEDKEPTHKDIQSLMEEMGLSYYSAREHLRSIAYGGSPNAKPPGGYSSWGDYWKAY